MTTNTQQITIKELRALFSQISQIRDRLLLQTLYETGCEVEEVCVITYGDIRGNEILLKSDEKRYARISSKLSKQLRVFCKGNQLAKSDYLFTTRQSSHISVRRVHQICSQISKTSGFSFKPHTLRNLHVLHAYSKGVLLQNIANQLGLTSYRIFQIIEQFQPRIKNKYQHFLSVL